MSESENIKSLIISTVQELWDDKEALEKFLGVVRRSPGFGPMADEFGKMTVRPANATFYGVRSKEFQA
ncbi:hypothetical protein ACFQ0M_49025 [Kitasatospora aburaviensis]|uniref:Uncharacterized protein n=1 Tax=Kitasatospora aburaviensis TaxID=67265 RepID=A0ABW1F7C6_9ACTN